MKYTKLGRSDLSVSEICLGSMTWGSQNSEAEGHEQLDFAVEQGINFIDTAEMYPTTPRLAETTGRTEEIIGAWLKNRPDRDRLVVATKITGEGNRDVRNGRRVDGATVREALEDSLTRLQTDYIDLYQLHWPNRGSYHFRKHWTYDPRTLNVGDMDQEVADILGEVGRLREEGKLRAFGLSNESAWGVMKFIEASDRHGLPRIASIQNEYNLLTRLFDLDLAEVSALEDVTLLAWSPLAAGCLSGKYADGSKPAGSRMTIQENLNGRYHEVSEAAIARYLDVAARHGLDPAQMAIAFCLSRPFPTVPIIGATSMHQLKIDIAAADMLLSDAVLDEIQSIYRDQPRPI